MVRLKEVPVDLVVPVVEQVTTVQTRKVEIPELTVKLLDTFPVVPVETEAGVAKVVAAVEVGEQLPQQRPLL
ncbi:hypothetical protein DV707_10620 [Halobellus limi]|nr:hypothetical protein DV707_10620 [Halobellus limi]